MFIYFGNCFATIAILFQFVHVESISVHVRSAVLCTRNCSNCSINASIVGRVWSVGFIKDSRILVVRINVAPTVEIGSKTSDDMVLDFLVG